MISGCKAMLTCGKKKVAIVGFSVLLLYVMMIYYDYIIHHVATIR